jgi:YD repeat-containing protein
VDTLYYTYDSQGNETSVHSGDANGINETYTYDSQNRLSTVVDNNLPTGANMTAYAYDRCDCHGAK